ncbi:MAG: hypothetical protein PHP64_05150 [Actinomycetota bacterium]|nr:hypothetical protein [Actinomycetota bacterium]
MDFRDRLQKSDWVSGIAALVLLISVFLEWYHVGGGYGTFGFKVGASGWDATNLSIIVFLISLVAIAIVVLRVVGVDLSAIPVPMSVVLLALGGISTLIVLIRIVFRPHGVGVTASISYGIIVAFLASIVVAIGGALRLREEQ